MFKPTADLVATLLDDLRLDHRGFRAPAMNWSLHWNAEAHPESYTPSTLDRLLGWLELGEILDRLGWPDDVRWN